VTLLITSSIQINVTFALKIHPFQTQNEAEHMPYLALYIMNVL